jgi:hypothetical protein
MQKLMYNLQNKHNWKVSLHSKLCLSSFGIIIYDWICYALSLIDHFQKCNFFDYIFYSFALSFLNDYYSLPIFLVSSCSGEVKSLPSHFRINGFCESWL